MAGVTSKHHHDTIKKKVRGKGTTRMMSSINSFFVFLR